MSAGAMNSPFLLLFTWTSASRRVVEQQCAGREEWNACKEPSEGCQIGLDGVGEWGKIGSGAAQSHPLFTLSVHQVATKGRKLSGLIMFDQPWEDRELMEELLEPKLLHSWSSRAPKCSLLDREPHGGGGTLVSLLVTSPAGEGVPGWAYLHSGH